jgi:hypothetical protein
MSWCMRSSGLSTKICAASTAAPLTAAGGPGVLGLRLIASATYAKAARSSGQQACPDGASAPAHPPPRRHRRPAGLRLQQHRDRNRLLSAGSRPRAAHRGPLTWVGDMPRQPLRVLISGASVAGPTAAYWLCWQGLAVTVVERMPLARVRTSGHAVDLFGPAIGCGRMGRPASRGDGCPHPDRDRLIPARRRPRRRR